MDSPKPNQFGSGDFMAAELFDGCHLQLLTIVDKGFDVVAALNRQWPGMGYRRLFGR
jgi:hypothetical protein